ncbi:MAG: hypothetical protein Fur0046_04490 [Cyanobacteria bacterium J069]|nr:MAG: thiamine pyrophosphate-binding protein [Cyanobacteria bacterium J069]
MPVLKALATYYETLEKVTLSEVLLRYLKLEGIDTVFGVPGQGVSWIIYTLAMSEKHDLPEPEDGIRYIISRHDGSATFMADGYARVSGKLGVCLVTSGPGATNAVTGAAVAQADSSAVLTIGGEVSEEEFGRGGFQEGADSGQDVVTMYRSVTDYSELVSNASNFQTITHAYLSPRFYSGSACRHSPAQHRAKARHRAGRRHCWVGGSL